MGKSRRVDVLNTPIWQALIKLSVPVMLSYASQTMYNMVDAYFLAKLGTTEFAAPTIVYHLEYIFIAIGVGFSVAGSAFVSQYIGAGDERQAEKSAAQVILVVSILGVFVLLFALLMVKPMINILAGKENAVVIPYAVKYFRIVLYGIVFSYLFRVISSIFRGLGDAQFAMELTLIATLTNIVLDPVLIFGLGPLRGMGVSGAAWATTIARFIAVFTALYILVSGRRGFKVHLKDFIPDFALLYKILKVSIPSSIGHLITAFGYAAVMKAVTQFGPVVVSAYGIGDRFMGFITMFVSGLGVAVSVMFGQFVGAKRYDDAEKTVWTAILMDVVVIGSVSALTFFTGKYITMFFLDDPSVVNVGEQMFRYVSLAIPFYGAMNVFVSALSGAGKSVQATIVYVFRVWGARVPMVVFLAKFMGYTGVFVAVFLSNVVTMVVAYLFYRFTDWRKGVIHES